MNKFLVALLAAGSFALGSQAAMAAQFSVLEGGVVMASWQQSLTPTPLFYRTGESTVVSISDGDGLASDTSLLDYFNADYTAPGLTFAGGGLSDLNSFTIEGVQYYTNTEADPVFMVGTYTGGTDVRFGVAATLIISVPEPAPSVPEPATWGMMLAGLGIIGFAARHHRNVGVSYA